MPIVNNLELEINERTKSYARVYSSLIEDEFQRKRAFVAITALYALSNLINKSKVPVQKSMTIFRNPELNEKYEITDFYINDWHIDVRITTQSDNFLIPRIHEEYSIEPDFYAIVKVDSQLESAQLLGFLDPKTIKKEPLDYHYYNVLNNNLISYEQFIDTVKTKKTLNLKEEEHEFFLTNYLSLIDKEIDENSLKRILKHLFICPECRAEFCCFTGFEMVNSHIGNYPDILDDQTLNIIGAQAVNSKKYEGKEETVFFDEQTTNEKEDKLSDETEQEQEENSKDSSNEKEVVTEIEAEKEPQEETENNIEDDSEDSTVSDILDELFNIEEDTVPLHEIIDQKEDNNNSELQLIQDDNIAPSDIKENDFIEINNDNSPLEVIEEDNINIENISISSDDIDTSDDISLLEINDNDEELNIIEEENNNNEQVIDKVIVDYDDKGEPVYSYITNITPEETHENDFEPIDDIESTLPIMEIIDNTEMAKTENITKSPSTEEISDYASMPTLDYEANNGIEEIDNIEEEQETDNITEEKVLSANAGNEKNNLNDKLPEENTKTNVSETELNKETDSAVTEENEIIEEDSEEDDYEEQDDNDDNYDDEENEEDSYDINNEEITNNKPSNKKILFASVLAVAFIAISATTYGLIKKAADGETKISSEKQEVEVPTQDETSKIFEGINDNDIFNEMSNNTSNNTESSENLIPQEDAENMESGISEVTNTPPTNTESEPKQLTEGDLVTKQPTNDFNKIMADAFSDQSQFVTSVKGINWMCSPQLYTNEEFKSYLQKLDKALKVNINSNLLNSSSTPVNNSITYKIAIDNEGSLLRIQPVNSTGSDELDSIVLQSIKETLALQKTQIISNSKQKSDKYLLQVVIKL